MKQILTLAKWEVLRLRSRFNGKSGLIIVPVLLLALSLSYLIYHQDFAVSKGFYTIGVVQNGPNINDPRFCVVIMDERSGTEALYQKKTIDVYIGHEKVLLRRDSRSQYAAGSLQKVLEKEWLARMAAQYPVDKAFPLRVEIDYLKTESTNSQGTIAELTPETLNPVQPFITDSLQQENIDYERSSELKADLSGCTPLPAPAIIPSAANEEVLDTGTNIIVRQQLANLEDTQILPEFKADFVSDSEIIVPSLMNPPMPLAQVVIAFLYIIPMFFVSVFFTSSFTEEKVNRKLVILLSTPVSHFQIILGKMLPYWVYSLLAIFAVTAFLRGNLFMAWAIFIPVMLFIFSIYLIVALTYRTFKDQTFFSVLALSIITVYLVVPAMFAGVNNLSYISPLTLAVDMYRGESFGLSEYLLATIPLYLTFLMAMFVGIRIFNEEFLMGFKSLRLKATEALYLAMDARHLNISVSGLSLVLIPIVFAVQLLLIVFITNLPHMAGLWLAMIISVVIEELAKSIGILVLVKKGIVNSNRTILKLSILSALGFWIGEKLLLLLTLKFTAESQVISAVLGSGLSNVSLLVIPLILHSVSTFIVCYLTAHRNKRGYLLGLTAGVAVHASYNVGIMLVSGVVS